MGFLQRTRTPASKKPKARQASSAGKTKAKTKTKAKARQPSSAKQGKAAPTSESMLDDGWTPEAPAAPVRTIGSGPPGSSWMSRPDQVAVQAQIDQFFRAVAAGDFRGAFSLCPQEANDDVDTEAAIEH